LSSNATLNDSDTTVDLLKKVYGELKNQKAKLLSLSNDKTEECKTNLMQSQSDFNICKIENENVATLVSLNYKEMNSSRNKERKELPNLVSNVSTTEMIKALQDECNLIERKFTSDGIEIKNAKEFAKENLTELFFSEGLSSNATLNDSDTTVDLLKKVYGELKNQKAKLLKLSNDNTEKCKTSLMQSQSDFNICKIENENVATLVSLHYKEMNSSRNKEWKKQPKLGSTTEMLRALQDECKLIEGNFTSKENELKNVKNFFIFNLTSLIPSSEIWNDNSTTLEVILNFSVKLKNQLKHCEKLENKLAYQISYFKKLLDNEENSYFANITQIFTIIR
jgi:hypothetical protein